MELQKVHINLGKTGGFYYTPSNGDVLNISYSMRYFNSSATVYFGNATTGA